VSVERHELLDAVEDEASFLVFIAGLIRDRRANNAEWQNETIEQFLEAGLAWAESTGLGATQGLENASPWKRAAVLLYCGKMYE